MKKFYKLLCCIVLVSLYACESEVQFERVKEAQDPAITTSVEYVKSYHVTFNPKANGILTFTLASGAEYKAKNLNASQLNSLITLLKSKDIQYDTNNEEFLLQAEVNE